MLSKKLRTSVVRRAIDIPPQVQQIIRPFSAIEQPKAPPLRDYSYDEFARMVQNKHVLSVEMSENSKYVKALVDDGTVFNIKVPESKSIDFMNKLQTYDVDVTVKQELDFDKVLQYFVQFVVLGMPVVLMILMLKKGNNPMQMGQSTAVQCENIDTKFEDVAGLKNAKNDLQEIVEFLKNPGKFSRLGAKIPKGCLLSGPSGIGKTLVAKAIAGEAGVPFFYSSASEFVQMFVGVGASRIRSIFEKANEKTPCIIFIDEIDAIGKARGMGFNGGNDEREQTINQLLVEMDGFKSNNGVIVIAATNRADILDPALMRAGRFDRHIHIELPEFKDRIEILKVHTRGKPLEDAFDFERVAKATSGFSGADLAMLSNEAAILAARHHQNVITQDDFDTAFEKICLGDKKETVVSEEKRRVVAYHEAGHALIGYLLGDNVKKISIIARGKTGGVTMFEPEEDGSGLYSKEYLENQIAVALGGRISEEIVFGKQKTTSGASGDINIVQNTARHMVTHYGLNEKLGPIAWHSGKYSQETMAQIDSEVKKTVAKAYVKTKTLMLKHRKNLDDIAGLLLEKETISGDELERLMKQRI